MRTFSRETRRAVVLLAWVVASSGGCLTERTNEVYCDIETQCSAPMSCDYRLRTCVIVEDASVGSDAADLGTAPDLQQERRDGGACMPASAGKDVMTDCMNSFECSSLICQAGKCLDQGDAIYVNNSDPQRCDPSGTVASGCPSDPFCTIPAGLAAAQSLNKHHIVVVGSATAYSLGTIGTAHPSAVWVVGPGRDATPPATITNFGSGVGVSLHDQPGSVAIQFQELVIEGGVGCTQTGPALGISLQSNKIPIENGSGIFSVGCSVIADSNLIRDGKSNMGTAVVIQGGFYSITNNVIQGITAPATSAAFSFQGGKGNFSFNTVANVTAAQLFDCGSGPVILDNSIVVTNSGTALSFGCSPSNSIVSSGSGLPDFVNAAMGDFHLQNTAASQACCIDKGMPRPDATIVPPHDFDDSPRPYGSALDVGAYEWHP